MDGFTAFLETPALNESRDGRTYSFTMTCRATV